MQVRNKTSDLKSLAIPAEYLTVQNKHAPKSVHNHMYRAFTEANRYGFPQTVSMEILRGPAGIDEISVRQRCPEKTLWRRGRNLL